MRRLMTIVAVITIVGAACSSDGSGDTDTTTTQPAETTTSTAPATTTTAAATTTEAPTTTTTTQAPGAVVEDTPISAVLQPYNDGGATLFPPGSVEAHWYQWDGRYVVLYRGFDASTGDPMCPGNSVALENTGGFDNISNSPINGAADEVCIGSPTIVEAPDGSYVCDTLLYYYTMIPTDFEGNGALFGTLELGTGEWIGQTSQVLADLEATPEFEPGLDAYTLPATNVDDGGVVSCA